MLCSRNQFGLQVQKRWKLQKNFKRKSQQDAFAKLQAQKEMPTEILIDNRPISFKKIKKTAVAMSTARKKQADGNAQLPALDKNISHHPTPNQTDADPSTVNAQDEMSRMYMKIMSTGIQPIKKLVCRFGSSTSSCYQDFTTRH